MSVVDFLNSATDVVKAAGNTAVAVKQAGTAVRNANLQQPAQAGAGTLPREPGSAGGQQDPTSKKQNEQKWTLDPTTGLLIIGGLFALWLGIRVVRSAGA